MNLKNIDFYYFSGTGNTFLIVKKMKQAFEKNDIKVNLYRLEKTKPKDVDLNNTIGLGFPVAEQGTYPFVWDFVKSLPLRLAFPKLVRVKLESKARTINKFAFLT